MARQPQNPPRGVELVQLLVELADLQRDAVVLGGCRRSAGWLAPPGPRSRRSRSAAMSKPGMPVAVGVAALLQWGRGPPVYLLATWHGGRRDLVVTTTA